jgi:hypothetical protein
MPLHRHAADTAATTLESPRCVCCISTVIAGPGGRARFRAVLTAGGGGRGAVFPRCIFTEGRAGSWPDKSGLRAGPLSPVKNGGGIGRGGDLQKPSGVIVILTYRLRRVASIKFHHSPLRRAPMSDGKFSLPIKCQCGRVGAANWDRNAKTASGDLRCILLSVSDGFRERNENDSGSKVEVICECGRVIDLLR